MPLHGFPDSKVHGAHLGPTWTRACFLSLARSKLRLCSANHRAGYFSNLACDWLSIVWAYSKRGTENGPRWAHVGPMNLVICVILWSLYYEFTESSGSSPLISQNALLVLGQSYYIDDSVQECSISISLAILSLLGPWGIVVMMPSLSALGALEGESCRGTKCVVIMGLGGCELSWYQVCHY